MISRLRMVAAISAAFVLLVAAPALAEHSWSNYHWPTGNQAPTVTGETPTLGNVSVIEVVNDWAGLGTGIQPGYLDRGKGDITVVAKRGNPNWIGMAQIKIDSGHILEGKVTLNSFYTNYDNGTGTDNIWSHVLCQEIGHILGLTHDRDNKTCMNDSPGTLGMYPTTGGHDGLELNSIYDGHPDGTGGTSEPSPNCNPKAKKCKAGAGQWITVHVFSMPASAIGH